MRWVVILISEDSIRCVGIKAMIEKNMAIDYVGILIGVYLKSILA